MGLYYRSRKVRRPKEERTATRPATRPATRLRPALTPPRVDEYTSGSSEQDPMDELDSGDARRDEQQLCRHAERRIDWLGAFAVLASVPQSGKEIL